MLARCDGEEQEDEGDDEGPQNLVKGLTHQCSVALHVRGLPTGFCRDIHGQVCVRKSFNVAPSRTCVGFLQQTSVFCVFRWKYVGGRDKRTGSAHRANYFSTKSTIKERPSLLVGPPALFSKSPPSGCHSCLLVTSCDGCMGLEQHKWWLLSCQISC